jgi:hypothetical protein
MRPPAISTLVFAVLFASALTAMRLRLPDTHLSGDTKDTVKLAMGLVATMTALVLGLLVGSTKEAYDAERNEVTQMAAKVLFLDQLLAGYGPESGETRKLLRSTVGKAINLMWSDANESDATTFPAASWNDSLPGSIQGLQPQNDRHTLIKAQSAQLAADLSQIRWLLFEQSETAISMPMLTIVVCWLAILFFSFGLFAPANATATGALLIGALSVSGAIFLILEMDHPFDGLIRISDKPMRTSLVKIGG